MWGSDGLHYICKAYIYLNKLDKAKEVLQALFTLAETRAQRGLEVFAWALKAKLEFLEGKTSHADIEAMLQKSMSLASERGMEPHIEECTLLISELHKKMGGE